MAARTRTWTLLRRATAAAAAVALAAGLAGCGGDAEALPFSGTVLDNPYTVPATQLTDTDDQPFSLADDTDERLTMVFFGYVNCVDICPAVLNHLASAMTRLDEDDRDQVQVVLVSSDPENDTPETLRTYLDRFDPSFVGLDGDLSTVIDIGRELSVGIDPDDPGGHTTYVMGVDAADEVPVFWDAQTTPAQFASDIHSLLQDG
ncbi:SCO family protein [Nocardioides litoris]|uniref:SCO family protein n=1 Tax=Nocardioides litoris TaxID=1926648 RepID=UPI0011235E93|nr:SCO family protein [Nocardioides litoris]